MSVNTGVIKDSSGNDFYPHSYAEIIHTSGGSDVETELGECAKTPITTSMISNGAITKEKLAPGVIGEVVYEYIQETNSSVDIPISIDFDFSTYRKFDLYIGYCTSDTNSGYVATYAYYESSPVDGYRSGIYLPNSDTPSGVRQHITSGEMLVTYKDAFSPPNLSYKATLNRVIADGEIGCSWSGVSYSASGFAMLSGIWQMDNMKYTLRKPYAGATVRVIGYR